MSKILHTNPVSGVMTEAHWQTRKLQARYLEEGLELEEKLLQAEPIENTELSEEYRESLEAEASADDNEEYDR